MIILRLASFGLRREQREVPDESSKRAIMTKNRKRKKQIARKRKNPKPTPEGRKTGPKDPREFDPLAHRDYDERDRRPFDPHVNEQVLRAGRL